MDKAARTVRPATTDDRIRWQHMVSHPLQSWPWGEFRRAMGVDTVRLVVREKEGWQITFHRIPHTPFTVGYFPKGPAPTKTMIRELTKLGAKKRALFIQIEPNVAQRDIKRLSLLPLRASHHPLFTPHTFVLDMRPGENDLLRLMHHKTRYNIRVAQRHGVVVAEETDPKGFEEYLALMTETTSRQKFFAHNEHYHRTMWKHMSQEGAAKLFTARVKGELAAAWVIFLFGDTIYYPYGASSRKHRESMAPNLLLWEIVRWGKQHGYAFFDLWGALGPNPDPNDPWYGFHRFKEGYRPTLVSSAGSFDLVLRPTLYKLYTIADRLRWMWLNRKT
jgi:lipid II:glycine glycyltransferase (peptidoglycan interpeptide bridge formation enzyme)